MAQARSHGIDNAKGILILLVVWGHLIERAAFSGAAAEYVYAAIYLFHMHAFAMVSGAVSKPVLTRAALGGIVRKILVPLVIFQLLYWVFLRHTVPYKLGGLLTPHWMLWFLLSFALWKLLLPLFLRLRYPVLAAVLLTLVLGFWDMVGKPLSLSRSFYFFPAFLIGHLYLDDITTRLRGHGLWSVLAAVLLIGLGVAAFGNGLDLKLLFGRSPYALTPDAGVPPLLARLVLIAAGCAISVLLLAAIPERASLFSELGQKTFAVYLWHGFLVVIFWRVVESSTLHSDAAFLLLSFALSFPIAFGLAYLRQAAGHLLRRAA